MESHDELLDRDRLDQLKALEAALGQPVIPEVIGVYLDDGPRRLDGLREALARGDAADLEGVAHSLKGSSGNVGARRVQELCLAIEERAKAGDVAAVGPLLERLEDAYAATRRALVAERDASATS